MGRPKGIFCTTEFAWAGLPGWLLLAVTAGGLLAVVGVLPKILAAGVLLTGSSFFSTRTGSCLTGAGVTGDLMGG